MKEEATFSLGRRTCTATRYELRIRRGRTGRGYRNVGLIFMAACEERQSETKKIPGNVESAE